jgi:hypothetical protein
LEAALSPTTVAPNGRLAYESVDPCPAEQGAYVHAAYGPDGWSSTEGGTFDEQDSMLLSPDDGSWRFELEAPAEPGTYEVVASCRHEGDGLGPDGEQLPPEAPYALYSPTDFVVTGPAAPSTTVGTVPPGSPAAPPARPVTAQPTYTG